MEKGVLNLEQRVGGEGFLNEKIFLYPLKVMLE
jgi:hypothetical protein